MTSRLKIVLPKTSRILHSTKCNSRFPSTRHTIDLTLPSTKSNRLFAPSPRAIPKKPYGFTEALRRKPIDGKYAAFYRIDEGEGIVCVERILHSKADFNRIHFGN